MPWWIIPSLILTSLARAEISADFGGTYNWGTYAAAGGAKDAHGGMAAQLFGGYRPISELELGLTTTFGFPQISSSAFLSDASFSQWSLGLQLGYLWRGKFEPFIHYSPFAELSQSTKSRLGVGTLATDVNYSGHSFGAGMKFYLSDRFKNAAQVGLKFMYTRESYGQVKVSSNYESNSEHAAPPHTPTSATQPGEQAVSGDTYSMGVFIGI